MQGVARIALRINPSRGSARELMSRLARLQGNDLAVTVQLLDQAGQEGQPQTAVVQYTSGVKREFDLANRTADQVLSDLGKVGREAEQDALLAKAIPDRGQLSCTWDSSQQRPHAGVTSRIARV